MSADLFDVEAGTGGSVRSVVLRLHVQPAAGRAAVLGRYANALWVKVAPAPVDGRANVAVSELVAELLGVSTSAVEVVSGARHRDKRVRVRGVDPDEVARLLDEATREAAARPGARTASRRR